jgi:hypothetical protein
LPGSSPILSSPFSSPARNAATQALVNSVPSVLPPLSSNGIIASSPIVGTKERKLAASYRKRERKRANTVAARKVVAEEEAEENKTKVFDEIHVKLRENGLTFGQLMVYVFDPIYKQGTTRWDGFFKEQGMVTRILHEIQ